MSPASVVKFLKAGQEQFDVVIIDEASQMRPEQAIGAISRGAQAVIVGDPMQLPPTSFFMRTGSGNQNQDNLVDEESILDLALARLCTKGSQ